MTVMETQSSDGLDKEGGEKQSMMVLQSPSDVTKQSKAARGETAFWSNRKNKLVRRQ